MNLDHFDALFLSLTGNPPFPWQRELYRQFVEEHIPTSCNLPTGLGKTAVIPIWLIALAHHPEKMPRRLVYVVNRRTVVDQATGVVLRLREKLASPELAPLADHLRGLTAFPDNPDHGPLAISTLRGQLAENAEWWKDPARPAIVIGTVDLIGSRLLFSGYRSGFRYRPLYAGFLGQDALIVHDEAHLEPAFQKLLTGIEAEQGQRGDKHLRPVRVMALTATSRDGRSGQFGLTSEEKAGQHAVVRQRIMARKGIKLHSVGKEKGAVANCIAELALAHRESKQAVLIFVRTLADVAAVEKAVAKANLPYQVLTGTIRGRERDGLVKDDVFRRFLPDEKSPVEGTVYLISTSAGEVGVDLSADHLVCDLTPFDSMAQRFGRVNRRGGNGAFAHIDIVYESEPDPKNAEMDYEKARRATLLLLRGLPECDWDLTRREACPQALAEVPADARQAAFTPLPRILPVDGILFDAWALTTIRDELPGRPPVADWLHGVEENTVPETHVAWREEVQLLRNSKLTEDELAELLDAYPLKPHELLRDRFDRVFEHLKKRAEDQPELPVWLLSPAGKLEVFTLGQLAAAGPTRLANATVVLPPAAGGLTPAGMLLGEAAFDPSRRDTYDVADELRDEDGNLLRWRKTITPGEDDRPPQGIRRVAAVPVRPRDEDEELDEATDLDEPAAAGKIRLFFVQVRAADDEGSATARQEQKLPSHLERAEEIAAAIARAVRLDPQLMQALVLAARWHDLGKWRAVWQKSIGNRNYPTTVLAKSGRRGPLQNLTDYRHEFGSLLDVTEQTAFKEEPDDVRELVLHLIAAHHGRGRPHFPAEEAFDPEPAGADGEGTAREVPRRYARLQRRYGRWGLAWLESLLRAADAYASANPKEECP